MLESPLCFHYCKAKCQSTVARDISLRHYNVLNNCLVVVQNYSSCIPFRFYQTTILSSFDFWLNLLCSVEECLRINNVLKAIEILTLIIFVLQWVSEPKTLVLFYVSVALFGNTLYKTYIKMEHHERSLEVYNRCIRKVQCTTKCTF